MYDGKRSPELLFEALRVLRDRGEPAGDARVHFYGPNSEFVRDVARRYGLAESVVCHGTIPRCEALLSQRAAAALLIFLNMDPATGNEMGSKYLEYLGARRPILAFGPPNSVMRGFTHEHRLGWFAASVDEATNALREAHERFVAGDFELPVDPVAFPSARELAQRFARVLDGAIYATRIA
jgi:hypothetical protein